MVATSENPANVVDEDGMSLREKLRRAERADRIKTFGLVIPLFAFILVTFVFPILLMTYRSIDNPIAVRAIPKTLQALEDWTSASLPGEETYRILGEELLASRESGDLGKLATRLNYDVPGSRSAITRAARAMRRGLSEGQSYSDLFLKVDKKWGKPEIWAGLNSLNSPLTKSYYLAALDLATDLDGGIVFKPEEERIYVALLYKTLWVSPLGYGFLHSSRLPNRLSNGDFTGRYGEPFDDSCSVAVLDFAAGAHDILDCTPSVERGCSMTFWLHSESLMTTAGYR